MNWPKLGKLDALLFAAVSGAKDHHGRSVALVTSAFVTIAARYVSVIEHYFDTRRFWSNLAVRPDDCRRCWPSPFNQTSRTSRRLTAARHPSDREVLVLIEEKREAFRAERKKAGRDVLLRAAMNHFGLSRKVVLAIWNSAPRNRKGGRPKKKRTEG